MADIIHRVAEATENHTPPNSPSAQSKTPHQTETLILPSHSGDEASSYVLPQDDREGAPSPEPEDCITLKAEFEADSDLDHIAGLSDPDSDLQYIANLGAKNDKAVSNHEEATPALDWGTWELAEVIGHAEEDGQSHTPPGSPPGVGSAAVESAFSIEARSVALDALCPSSNFYEVVSERMINDYRSRSAAYQASMKDFEEPRMNDDVPHIPPYLASYFEEIDKSNDESMTEKVKGKQSSRPVRFRVPAATIQNETSAEIVVQPVASMQSMVPDASELQPSQLCPQDPVQMQLFTPYSLPSGDDENFPEFRVTPNHQKLLKDKIKEVTAEMKSDPEPQQIRKCSHNRTVAWADKVAITDAEGNAEEGPYPEPSNIFRPKLREKEIELECLTIISEEERWGRPGPGTLERVPTLEADAYTVQEIEEMKKAKEHEEKRLKLIRPRLVTGEEAARGRALHKAVQMNPDLSIDEWLAQYDTEHANNAPQATPNPNKEPSSTGTRTSRRGEPTLTDDELADFGTSLQRVPTLTEDALVGGRSRSREPTSTEENMKAQNQTVEDMHSESHEPTDKSLSHQDIPAPLPTEQNVEPPGQEGSLDSPTQYINEHSTPRRAFKREPSLRELAFDNPDEQQRSLRAARERLADAHVLLNSDLSSVNASGVAPRLLLDPETTLDPGTPRIPPSKISQAMLPLEDDCPSLGIVEQGNKPQESTTLPDPLSSPFSFGDSSFSLPQFHLPSAAPLALPGPSTQTAQARVVEPSDRTPSPEESWDELLQASPVQSTKRKRADWLDEKIKASSKRRKSALDRPRFNLFREGNRPIVFNNPSQLMTLGFNERGVVPFLVRSVTVEQERAQGPHYRTQPIAEHKLFSSPKYGLKESSPLNPEREEPYACSRSSIQRALRLRQAIIADVKKGWTEQEVIKDARLSMLVEESMQSSFRKNAKQNVKVMLEGGESLYCEKQCRQPLIQTVLVRQAAEAEFSAELDEILNNHQTVFPETDENNNTFEWSSDNEGEDERDDDDDDDEKADKKQDEEIPDSPASPEPADANDSDEDVAMRTYNEESDESNQDSEVSSSEDVEMGDAIADEDMSKGKKESSALADCSFTRSVTSHVMKEENDARTDPTDRDDSDGTLVLADDRIDTGDGEPESTTPPNSPPRTLQGILNSTTPPSSPPERLPQHVALTTVPSVDSSSTLAHGTFYSICSLVLSDISSSAMTNEQPLSAQQSPPVAPFAHNAIASPPGALTLEPALLTVPENEPDHRLTDEALFAPHLRVPIQDRWREEWRVLGLPLLPHAYPQKLNTASRLISMFSISHHQPKDDGNLTSFRASERAGLCGELYSEFRDERATFADRYRNAHLRLMRPYVEERLAQREQGEQEGQHHQEAQEEDAQ